MNKMDTNGLKIKHFGKRSFREKRLHDFLIPALLIIIAEILFVVAIYNAKMITKKKEAAAVGHEIAATIQLEIDRCVNSTVLLRDMYFIYGDSFLENYDRVCEMFLEDNIVIGSMYLAPDGIIEYAYPDNVDQYTMKYNMLEDPVQGMKARLARDSQRTTIAGPHSLIEGGEGFVLRNPMFQDGRFLGFTVCVIDRELLESQLLKRLNQDCTSYDFAIWKQKDSTALYDENGYILTHGAELKDRDVIIRFPVPNDTWYMTLRPSDGWGVWRDIHVEVTCSLVVVLVFLFGCYLLVRNSSREEERIRLSENESIINQAGIGIWNVILEQGKPNRLSINGKMMELLGFAGEEHTEEELYDLWYARIEETSKENLFKATDKMKKGFVEEVMYLWNHPTLGERYVRCGGTSIRDRNGNIILRGYHVDVTEAQIEHKYQEKHEQEMLLLQKLVMAALDTVYPRVVKANLTQNTVDILAAESYFEGVVGDTTSVEELIEITSRLVPNDGQRAAFRFKFNRQSQIEAYEKGERSIQLIHQQMGEDGDMHWMETSVIFVETDSPDIIQVSFSRCVDDEIESENMLMQAMEEAERASSAKTDFLFSMSHDIRTPMNAIIGFTGLLKNHLDDPDKSRDYLSKIEQSSEYLLSLINNVLGLARIESGKAEVNASLANTREMGGAVIVIFSEQFVKKNIEFDCYLHAEHENVYMDTVKIREIFLNLISNALKYTPEGGKVCFHTEEIPCAEEGYCIYRTIISDTGIGMSKEFLPHLFEDFSREHSSTESKVSGTGLGMPIVKRLLDLIGGTIEVESELGKGTTFTIEVRYKIASEDEISRLKNRGRYGETSEAPLTGKRILLAEDNDLNAEITMEILREYGIESERAEDGIQCLAMIERAEPFYYDAVLMDIQMPNMDGYKATQMIRAMDDPGKSDIPILAMTANAFEEDVQQALAVGMNGHLAKPIEVDLLIQTIRNVLNR